MGEKFYDMKRESERRIYSQSLHDGKMYVFKVPQISMKMSSMERETKTDQESGMLCHVWTNISRDMSDQRSEKMQKLLIRQNISIFD